MMSRRCNTSSFATRLPSTRVSFRRWVAKQEKHPLSRESARNRLLSTICDGTSPLALRALMRLESSADSELSLDCLTDWACHLEDK